MTLIKTVVYQNQPLSIYSDLPDLMEYDPSTGDLLTPDVPSQIGVELPSGNIAIYVMYELSYGPTRMPDKFYWAKERVIKGEVS